MFLFPFKVSLWISHFKTSVVDGVCSGDSLDVLQVFLGTICLYRDRLLEGLHLVEHSIPTPSCITLQKAERYFNLLSALD